MINQQRASEYESLFREFVKDYDTQVQEHLGKYEEGRRTAKLNFELMRSAESQGEDFTELALHRLLPHTDSPAHRASNAWICVAPAVQKDVRVWFEGAGWTKKGDWPRVATALWTLVRSSVEDPESVGSSIANFVSLPYSKGFQAGLVTPILNALNPDAFVILNNKSRRVANHFAGTGFRSSKLDVYEEANRGILQLALAMRPSMQSIADTSARPTDLFDMFCHWLYAVKKYPPIVDAKVKTEQGEITVTIPVDDPESEVEQVSQSTESPRESHLIQAKVATLGAKLGFRIWLPKSDRGAVLPNMPVNLRSNLAQSLPLNYDQVTIKTIEQIDVLWLKGRSMVRAFEIEHTTSIYSGLLRMADLLALQPNMDIRLHIVAPSERRQKTRQEILRPIFSLLDRKPLSKMCSFISYDKISELSALEHVEFMSDSVLDKYAESFSDEDEDQ